ncbi:hypothetical protein BC826DRAFT_447049 [Russula brevipes]|nr:hypothetical protein BC826DRAFT_447049 [Russula brevipes]
MTQYSVATYVTTRAAACTNASNSNNADTPTTPQTRKLHKNNTTVDLPQGSDTSKNNAAADTPSSHDVGKSNTATDTPQAPDARKNNAKSSHKTIVASTTADSVARKPITRSSLKNNACATAPSQDRYPPKQRHPRDRRSQHLARPRRHQRRLQQ